MPSPHSGYAPVNGIRMYYEIHGQGGTPLVLLHGGGSTIDVTFGKVLPHFARHRAVIALEEQGHGRSSDRAAPVRFDTSADDVAALLDYLDVSQAHLFGFSNGASVAMQVALRHPGKVRKLVYASSMTRKDGVPAEFWQSMQKVDFVDMPQPLKDAFLKVNPDPQKLLSMFHKDAERMQQFEDVPDVQVRSIKAPTLILSGDRDLVKPEHAVELSRLIAGARLAILPGAHGEYLGEALAYRQGSRAPEHTAGLVEEFLDA